MAAWLRLTFGIAESRSIADQVMSVVWSRFPFAMGSEDELTEDGFKPIIVESAPR
jgi:hypothetical protein